MLQVTIHQSMELLHKVDVRFYDARFILVLGEHDLCEKVEHVCKCVHNRVYISTLLPALSVIVAVAYAELSEYGTKLSQFTLYSTLGERGLGETTTEFAALSSCFLRFPIGLLQTDFVVRLPMVLEHLPEWICSTL